MLTWRRFPPMPGALFVGDWRVESALHRVTGPDGPIHLEPKVMRVLVVLAEHAGQVVPKDRLLQSVWPDVFVGDEVLARAISELRRVFGDDAKAPRFIETIPKGGYRLIAPVTATGGVSTASQADSDELRWTPLWHLPRRVFRARSSSWSLEQPRQSSCCCARAHRSIRAGRRR